MEQDLKLEQEKPSPWYNLLMHPSRALWRSSPQPPPKYIMDMQADLIQRSGRRTKQLKRTYDIILKQQRELIQSRELERRQLVNGTRKYPSKTRNHANAESLSSPIDSNASPIYYKPEYSLSSLKFRLVPNYSITKRVLAETQSLIGISAFQPKRILDVGCGVGSASAAALEYFHQGRGIDRGFQVQWIHAIDPSQSMRDAAQYILQDWIQHTHKPTTVESSTRITFGDSLTSSTSSSSPPESSSKGFDLALCVYTLCEIPSVASALSMAAMIWEKLALDGVAIFIEPGTGVSFLFYTFDEICFSCLFDPRNTGWI
jgi:SAM-dependent methyltransferase